MCIDFAIVTTLKTSAAETLAFVRHHLAFRPRKLWVFFDDPDDASISLVEDLGATVIRCTPEHWSRMGGRPGKVRRRQMKNATQALEWAAEESIGWLLHIDSDEFLLCEQPSFDAVLAEVEGDVLALPPMETVPVIDSGGFSGPRSFKLAKLNGVMGRTPQIVDGIGLDASELRTKLAQLEAEFGPDRRRVFEFTGHRQGKAATRVNLERVQKLAPHTAKPREGVTLDKRVMDGCAVLHYDGHDLECWVTKWEARVTGVRAIPGVSKRREWLLNGANTVYADGGRRGLEQFFLENLLPTDDEMNVAESLGLIRRLDEPVVAVSRD